MGENAEDVINGSVCDLCMRPFAEKAGGELMLASHGHPATCSECWHYMTKKQRRQHQRATYRTMVDSSES